MSILLAALCAGTLLNSCPPVAKHDFKVADHKFLLDGKPLLMIAGEMHYERIPRPLWPQRIQMAKAMGLNTVAIYCFWNMHEPEKGKFKFTGNEDVREFIKECARQNMWVMLRPGPYCCAEWEFGGYPSWLLNEPNLHVRTTDPAFMGFSKRYLAKMAGQVADLQVTHGGPILMVQVENEYGSYGKDHAFMAQSRDMLRQVGFDVPLYVAEGGNQLANAWVSGTIPGVNGAGWPDAKEFADKYMPGGPYLVPEFYPGWLDHWGEPKSHTDGDVPAFASLLEHGVSASLYMFHGGTNFGYQAGANYDNHLQPSITSYDYDAPLDEAGRPTPKFFAFRDAIAKATKTTPPPVPEAPKVATIPRFKLTRRGGFAGSLGPSILNRDVKPMEFWGQSYGYALYRTRVRGISQGKLTLHDLRDYAVVLLDGQVMGTLDCRLHQESLALDLSIGEHRLDILVENSGRINYGRLLPDNHKGITDFVEFNGRRLEGWQMFALPLAEPPTQFDNADLGPGFFTGSFEIKARGEAFLDMRGWPKGVVWVNGHHLGRYWHIGPQQTLYLPSCWLRIGRNDVVVFDLGMVANPSIEGLAAPILSDLQGK